MNYHTLNDFRVGHGRALDELFTRVLAALMKSGEVTVTRVSQDGTRVRASAGAGGFRTGERLNELLQQAKAQVENLKKRNDPGVSQRTLKMRERAASDRPARIESALEEVKKMEAARKASGKSKSGRAAPRASTTDPTARRMKMGNGGFSPAYNVQFAADTASRAIVGVRVTNAGNDSGLGGVMREHIEQKTGSKVREHLTDAGYVDMDEVDRAAGEGVRTARASTDAPPKHTGSSTADRWSRSPSLA